MAGSMVSLSVIRLRTSWKDSDIDIVVAGSKDAIIMVEGCAAVVSEEDMLNAIFFGHEAIQPILTAQEELRCKGRCSQKRSYREITIDRILESRVETCPCKD